MKRASTHFAALLLLPSCFGAVAAEPTAYRINAERSEILAFVGPDLLAPFWMFTDRHVVRIKQIEGSVRADPGDIRSCQIEVRVPSNQLEIDSPELRDELGWERMRPDDRASVRHAIEGESILWVEEHPTIAFRAERCDWIEGGRVELRGVLTLRGVDRPIEVPLSVAFERDTFEATGTFEIQHEDFGMLPYANALGTIKIGRTITIVVRVVGVRSSGPDLEA